MEHSDGDSDMMLKLNEQFTKAGSIATANKEENDAVRDYMARAFGSYHGDTFTSSEKPELFKKFMNLTNEAYNLHTQGVTPESEEAQKLAKAFWETLMEYTDGNMDLIQQMNEKNAKHQDKKTEVSNRFLEAALEIYFERGYVK
jgi:hypothetical protein